jgi:hypothetical protein
MALQCSNAGCFVFDYCEHHHYLWGIYMVVGLQRWVYVSYMKWQHYIETGWAVEAYLMQEGWEWV